MVLNKLFSSSSMHQNLKLVPKIDWTVGCKISSYFFINTYPAELSNNSQNNRWGRGVSVNSNQGGIQNNASAHPRGELDLQFEAIV